MPTQEERLSALEQTVPVLGKGIRDLNHNATILLGVTSEQGKDIREMKVSLAALTEHLDAFEQGVNNRFETQQRIIESFEQGVNGRFEALEGRLGSFEQGVNGRFEALEGRLGSFEQSVNGRFEAQDRKLDQVLQLLTALTPKPDQEI